uniref:Uncharacterized protein n=1 Tax=Arundo donax TaxID=35708 RepID=A0A0A9GHT2_ARUDO
MCYIQGGKVKLRTSFVYHVRNINSFNQCVVCELSRHL